MNNPMLEGVKNLMKETFDCATEAGSWYTDGKPEYGIFGTLNPLSAEEASVPVNGTTIAAHTDHTRYYLWMANTYMKGEVPKTDWSLSWKITSVDEGTWEKYQDQLQQEYKTLLKNIDRIENVDEQTANGLLGSLAHCAYHLGSIRQMVKAVKVPSQT